MILTTINFLGFIILIIVIFYKFKKIDEEFLKINKKNIINSKDIKTLHLNQKVLQFSIKDLVKNLKTYGEVKKFKFKNFFGEENQNEGE